MLKRWISFLLILTLPAWMSGQTTVTINADADSYLTQSAPGTPNGTATVLYVYPWTPSWSRRSVIHFDLSSIPAGSIITRVTIDLYAQARLNNNPRTIGFHKIISQHVYLFSGNHYKYQWT